MMHQAHQRNTEEHFRASHRGGTVVVVTVLDRPVASPPADLGHRPGNAVYRRAVAGVAIGGMANFVLLYYVQPLLPSLAAEYEVSAGTSAQALSISTLTMAVALLGVGPLSDRVGRVAVMRWSLLASGVLGVASAFAPTWSTLLVLRGLMGVALAGLPAIALAYLREEVHASAHGRANAWYIMGTACGGALGRLLPVPLDAHLGWTGATLVVSGLTVAAGLAMVVLVPASRAFVPTTRGVRPLLLGIGATLRDPVVVAVCVLAFAAMGAFVGVYNAFAFRIQAPPYSLGASATLVYLAYPVGIVGPHVARAMAARWGRRGALLALLGLMVVGVAMVAAHPLGLMMVGLGALTFGFLATHSLATGWVVDRASRRGLSPAQASSNYLLAYYTGSAVVGTAAVHVWESGGWGAVTALALGLVLVAGAAVVVAARADEPSVSHPAAREPEAAQVIG